MRHFFYTLFFALIVFSVQAQNQDIDDYDAAIERRKVHTDFKESLFSVRFSTTLPAPVSNAVFRQKFRGIYEMNLSCNLRLTNNFFVGLGFKSGLLGLNNIPNPANNLDLNTKMQMYTGYVKVGINKYHTENIFSTFAVNIGYNSSNFTGVVNPKNETGLITTYTSMLIEPEYSLNFAIEDNFSIGIFVSYNYMPTVFNPTNIALQDVTSLTGLKQTSATGIINFGFGFYYGLGKKFPRRNK
ncbi:MAG TPA: hypothetical protein VNX01_08050 [Bacteroidia bacterium]|nr:hypothetical protein [Bacteroidia bacterium]